MSTTPQRTSKSDLPPKREGKAIRHDVSKPLQGVSLSRVVYLLTIFAVLFTAFYAYRIVQLKSEVGGWWNLALGRRPATQMNANTNTIFQGRSAENYQVLGSGTKQDVELESHIHAIASILGMQPTDLASALSSAVHQHVAPKTISSLSSSISSASAAGSSAPAANVLFSGDDAKDRNANSGGSGDEGMMEAAGTVAKVVEGIVGLGEPVMAD